MRSTKKRRTKINDIILKHIRDNIKEYIIVIIIFLIGILLGVLFINNTTDIQITEIEKYYNEFLNSLKNNEYYIDKTELIKTSIEDNIILVLLMWFIGSTVIGLPIVFGVVAFRGFCLGYTISSTITILGVGKGIMFFVSTILLQNLIFIPCLLALAVSGIKLYKSIIKDKRRENIKIEIIRHTLFSIMLLGILLISSLIEAYVSSNILINIIKYI